MKLFTPFKKLSLSLLLCLAAMSGKAQGWPADYGGVMLQAFAWDSYTETAWANLTSQADVLSKYFNLIWVPQSGYCNTTTNNMGYYPIYWFDQRSAFGTEAELRTMIKTFKQKGTGIIADVVVNHKNGKSKWCDFADESVTGQNTGKTYTVKWDPYTDICSTDEANTNADSEAYGKIQGSADTGENDGGCRDLDHTSLNVQKNIETYEDYLLNELGYTGFRYDMVKGYTPSVICVYNQSSKPTYSVGEYWDSDVSKVTSWIDGTAKTSAAFDFPMKYLIMDAMGGNEWKMLADYTTRSVVGKSGYAQYAVTFVDNHDTGEPHDKPQPLRANIAAANAYILAMPGTPCIWLSHWTTYKTIIKKCILARKLAGVTNTSTVETSQGSDKGYVLKVKGTKGEVLLLLGSPVYDTTGFQLACEGDNFKYYVSKGLDISEITAIEDEVITHTIPTFCTIEDGETAAFFEQPAAWSGTVNCWAWDASGNYTGGSWPGVACTKVGTTDDGLAVWKWTWDGSYTGKTASAPTGIIFSSSKQTNDMTFVNGGYYGFNIQYGTVSTTGISGIEADEAKSADQPWYTLQGQRLSRPTQPGLYIHGGKKVVVR